MSKILALVIIFIFIFGGIAGAGYYLYDKIESKKQIEGNKLNVKFNLKTIDRLNKYQVEVPFEVIVNSTTIFVGKTNLVGWEEINTTIDRTKNTYVLVGGNGYYTDMDVYMGNDIIHEASHYGNLTINEISRGDNNISLFLQTDYQYRQIYFCLKYSQSFINVWNDEFIEINRPQRFPNYVHCYHTQKNLAIDEENMDNEVSMNVTINYKTWRPLTSEDNIEIVFSDSDKRITKNDDYNYAVEGMSGESLTGNEVNYVMKF